MLLLLLLAVSLGLRVWHATPGLDEGRFVDERFPLENIEVLLKQGQWRPANGLHPGLSYLPHALLLKISETAHHLTGWRLLAIFDTSGEFSPTAYFICRMLQVFFGVCSLLLVYRIGRRLGDDTVGLFAALFLSTAPWHIRQSVVFKADMTLVVALTLAFYLSLRAIDRPTVGRYVAAGAAIGLALAAKFNAGPIAIPLVVGTLLAFGPSSASLLNLILAGAVSVAVFLAINPFALIEPGIYQRSMGSTLRVYERKAAQAGIESRFELIPHAASCLASGGYFGRLVGTLGWVGILASTWISVSRWRRSKSAIAWLMVSSYVISYVALYATTTSKPDPHNWLPIAPFVALAAAWMVGEIWQRCSRFVTKRRGRRWLATAGSLALVVLIGWPALRFTYFKTVPTTADVALEFMLSKLTGPTSRLVLTETELATSPRYHHQRRRLAIGVLSDFTATDPSTLNLADVEIFPASRLAGPSAADFYRRRMASVGDSGSRIIRSRLFRAHGQELVCITHPLRRGRQMLEGQWLQSRRVRSLYTAQIPDLGSNRALVSLEFELPARSRWAEIEIDGNRYQPIPYHPHQRTMIFVTPRFYMGKEIVLHLEAGGYPRQIPLFAKRWREARR